METENVIIRGYRREDRHRVREICRKGGQRGNPISTYIEDEELVLNLIADYFIDREPESCLVAEVNGKIVGYVLGSESITKYLKIVSIVILPRLIARVLWKIITFQYRKKKTYLTIWWFIRRAWKELPGPPPDRYPAHIHLILDKDYRGFRIGRRLVDASAEHFSKKGIRGGHAVVIEEVGKNAFARVFGARVLEARKATLWDHCTNKQWEFKLLAKDFEIQEC